MISPSDIICQAIGRRCVLEFRHRAAVRQVEPHLVGYDHAGVALLSAWQLSGGSGVQFRSFRLDRLSAIAIVPRTFAGPRPGYNPDDRKVFARVICRL